MSMSYAPMFSKLKDEQSFKMKYIKMCMEQKELSDSQRIFCIETEETVKGFPDVMKVIIDKVNTVYFYEFKFSDKNGKIKFQPTQPSFYRHNRALNVEVVAYNQKTEKLHIFKAESLFDINSPYKMNEKAEVNLCLAEKGGEYEGTYNKS